MDLVSQIVSFSFCPTSVIEANGNQRTLPARLLNSDFNRGSGWVKKPRTELIQGSFQKLSPFRDGISRSFRASGSSTASAVHFRSSLKGLRLHNIWKENLWRSEALSKGSLRSLWACQPGVKHFHASAAAFNYLFLEKKEGENTVLCRSWMCQLMGLSAIYFCVAFPPVWFHWWLIMYEKGCLAGKQH